MPLLIDTSIIIDIEQQNNRTIKELKELSKLHPSPASISFITYFEFVHGLREKLPKNKDNAMRLIDLFHFLEATKKTAITLSDLKYKYEKLGKVFSLSDLMIASQAIEYNLTLITRDRHFQEIEELKKIIL
ncbi:MAG: type II toxin-antitoxin system VapC family toxin [Candidatus Aenigmarchaeota archaeon]|nr:type II toxin-antitoxin system VapC family toxin [Candidatus Aenigmarchaeota archaeon]